MTAKNLVIYSCFHYPLNMVAAQTAFSAIELAVRLRSDKEGLAGKLQGLHHAMQRAIIEKWIADDATLCSPIPSFFVSDAETREAPIDKACADQFVDVLAQVFPKYRNAMAHGSSIMNNAGADMVLDAIRIVNQIFRSVPA